MKPRKNSLMNGTYNLHMEKIPSSFRDPSGFLFKHSGNLYRQVNLCYKEEFDFLHKCGLYRELVNAGLLVSHEEIDFISAVPEKAYKVIRPQAVPFISYPYEWCFSQLKDAALLTLEILGKALAKGMSLKDASAYNIQFVDGKPIFIDTLSFERYEDGCPWVAYRQFCQHFLAPLALMSRTDIRLNQLFKAFIDGVPLELASTLLPFTSKFSISLGLHIHLHAHSQRKYASSPVHRDFIKRNFPRKSFYALLDSLYTSIGRLIWNPKGTEWFDYYDANNNYGEEGIIDKERVVSEFLNVISPNTVWDLGANTGRFSRIAAAGSFVVAWDYDPGCVETNYRNVRLQKEKDILPLFLDISNPSPGIGWDNNERMSFIERGPADAALLLGVIHHLAISNNVPFDMIANLGSKISRSLIIEFVPKGDSQVQKLLSTRRDVFLDYSRDSFEADFEKYFRIVKSAEIKNTRRILYLMEKRR